MRNDPLTSLTQAIAELSPDCIVWVRDDALDHVLVEEYRREFQGAGVAEVLEWELEGGEWIKQWQAFPALFERFSAWGMTRHSLLITTGGGALSDALGFAAAVWKRGMAVLHVPTTVLAAVDAAWGGKNGVNWGTVKNQIGTVTPPVSVHLDARWLRTLPSRQFDSGLAEVAKHAMLDPEFNLEDMPLKQGIYNQELESESSWTSWLHRCAESKMFLVREDLHEKGVRIKLNLGHTVGHAVEAHFGDSANPWLHGEAVALGLKFALHEAELSALDNTPTSQDSIVALESWIRKNIPLPKASLPSAEQLWSRMVHDKKNVKNEVRDLAWRGTGNVVGPLVWKKETFKATWDSFLRSLK